MLPQEHSNPDSDHWRLIEIGIALYSERNPDRLLEVVLLEAMSITRADGGTLYLRADADELGTPRAEGSMASASSEFWPRTAPIASAEWF